MTPEEFWAILHDIPDAKPVLFRLYYDDLGNPIEYTHEDRAGKYIDLDPETFRDAPRNARVVHGQLIRLTTTVTKKLQPETELGTCCSTQDVCVVVGLNQPHIRWNLKTNEQS